MENTKKSIGQEVVQLLKDNIKTYMMYILPNHILVMWK